VGEFPFEECLIEHSNDRMNENRMNADAQIDVRKAARAMARAGLSTAFGHCSVRLDADSFLVCRAGALSTIKPGESGSMVPVSGGLPEGVLGEVRIHQQIYARRPEIGAVCRFSSPNVMAVSALGRAPKIRHVFGAMFAPMVKYSDDIRLMRDDAIAAEVADVMGDSPGIIMRGIGAVTAGADIKQALCLAWFLEDMARLELAVLSSGNADQAPVYTADEALGLAGWGGQVAERAWDHLTALDPE
jgi:HCOMODA/2-hydroxy-3-carboxy-muconic semialdehyde decarboxylase